MHLRWLGVGESNNRRIWALIIFFDEMNHIYEEQQREGFPTCKRIKFCLFLRLKLKKDAFLIDWYIIEARTVVQRVQSDLHSNWAPFGLIWLEMEVLCHKFYFLRFRVLYRFYQMDYLKRSNWVQKLLLHRRAQKWKLFCEIPKIIVICTLFAFYWYSTATFSSQEEAGNFPPIQILS